MTLGVTLNSTGDRAREWKARDLQAGEGNDLLTGDYAERSRIMAGRVGTKGVSPPPPFFWMEDSSLKEIFSLQEERGGRNTMATPLSKAKLGPRLKGFSSIEGVTFNLEAVWVAYRPCRCRCRCCCRSYW